MNTQSALAAATPDWPDALRHKVAARASRMQASAGAQLFGPGDPCNNFIIPLSGTVRVEHMGAGGRSIVLYRVGPGESCVMTTSCLLAGQPYEAYGIAEEDLDALALSSAQFAELIDTDTAFRARAFGTFASRMIDLVTVIDALLLHRVDLRLAGWLAARAPAGGTLRTTHQTIAAELGTAREVVSRVLKDFEHRGWTGGARGAVEVRDPVALSRFAGRGGL